MIIWVINMLSVRLTQFNFERLLLNMIPAKQNVCKTDNKETANHYFLLLLVYQSIVNSEAFQTM